MVLCYIEKYIRSRTKYDISNIYMIGDNIETDIKGAEKKGWVPILVRYASTIFSSQTYHI